MASSLNKIMLMGNITRDIGPVRTTPSEHSVVTVGLAVNHRWKSASGEQKEETVFVDCDAWGKTGELIAQYFSKGRPIMVEGRLQSSEAWLDKKTNEPRSKNKVVIENFYFVDSKPGGGGGEGGASAGAGAGGAGGGGAWAPRQNAQPRQNQPAAAGAPASPSAPPPQMDADDIPF